jgi:hypothetical protein
MGYWVFQANLGSHTLGSAAGTGAILSLNSGLPQGSFIVAFLEGTSKGKNTATANSEAIMDAGVPSGGTGVPEPGTAALLMTALLGFGARLLRRVEHPRAAAA